MKSCITDDKNWSLCLSSGDLAISEIEFTMQTREGKQEITRNWDKSCSSGKAATSCMFDNRENTKLSVKTKDLSGGGIALNAELINQSSASVHIVSFSMKFLIEAWHPENCQFFHPQNINYLRIKILDEESCTGIDLFKIPDHEYRLGDSEDYALPVLIILNKNKNTGFVIGASTEDIFNKEFILKPEPRGLRVELIQCLKGVSEKEIKAGQSIKFESLFLSDGKAEFNNLLISYRNEIERNNKFIFPQSPLRKELIWGSWNMKIHLNQSEELILRNAEYVRTNFPKVKWIQIDEGWSVSRRWGECGYPDMDDSVDSSKFPHGMKYVADRVKEMGLKPAIWFPRMCCRDSLLFREKPHWFTLDREGKPFLMDSKYATLDPSVPEVKDYLNGIFDVIFEQWGYMGLKLDFFSDAFCARDIVYRYPGKSGVELMWEMFAEIRKRLPEDGYFLPGSSVSNANIFLGKYADIMRYGCDIDELETHPELFFRLFQKSALLTMLGSDSVLLCDSDAVGYFHYLPESAEKTLALWCYISGMMVEVGGDLPKADQRRLLDLKLLLDKPINGSPCRVLTQEFFSSNQAPAVLYNPEHRLLGIFNHSAKETIAGTFNIKDADGKLADISKIYEFWTGETISLSDGKISYELPPLASIGYRL